MNRMLEPGAFAQAQCPEQPVRSLSEETLAALRLTFSKHNHFPTGEMWVALKAIADTLEALANGTCGNAIHLSSLDPGIGKTTTVIHFLKALLASERHADVAAIVCAKRREQIQDMVEAAGFSPESFAVLTADPDLNALGTSPAKGRILMTTHAMVGKRTEGGQFAEVEAFRYRGKPRAVRVWDEAILPGVPLTVSRDMIPALLKPFRRHHPALAEAFEALFSAVKEVKHREQFRLPDLAEEHGVSLKEASSLVQGGSDELLSTVEALWSLFGKCATVRTEGKLGNTLLDYEETLAADLAPVLVLDASVRVRTVYELWRQKRGGIKMLPAAAKRYDNHTIHVWNTSGAKTGFENNREQLIEGIAKTIRTKPGEEWLIVHHKDKKRGEDFASEVRAWLHGDEVKTHFLNWGAHDAINHYADVPNVILAGTLFLPNSHYKALGRLASAHPSWQGPYPEADTRAVTLGEHRNLVLQALCRGAVRQCEDGGCPPTHTYLIASKRSGIRATLGDIFPGAKVVRWQPVPVALTGKVQEAFEYIEAKLTFAPSSVVPFSEVMADIGWTSTQDFKRSIRDHEDFTEALEEAQIKEWGKGTRKTGFRKTC
jgi:hypothetical protein